MAAVDTPTTARAERPTMPAGPRRLKLAITVVIAVLFVWGVTGLDVSIDRLRTAPGDAWDIFRRMWPPDFRTEIDRGVLGKVLESVYVAWIGTLMAAIISLPLSFLASNNVSPRIIRLPVRQLFNAIRSVPELIVAVIFVAVTGLGPWAGAMAIGLHSVGTLGKLSSEEIESAAGGTGRGGRGLRWPVVVGRSVGACCHRLSGDRELLALPFRDQRPGLGCPRDSSVPGGVGSELVSQLNFRNFPQVGAVLILTIGVVIAIDTVSGAVRRRIIAGSGRGAAGRRRGTVSHRRTLR